MKALIEKQIVITGLLAITILEFTALMNGIDGTLFALVIGIIAQIGILQHLYHQQMIQ